MSATKAKAKKAAPAPLKTAAKKAAKAPPPPAKKAKKSSEGKAKKETDEPLKGAAVAGAVESAEPSPEDLEFDADELAELERMVNGRESPQ